MPKQISESICGKVHYVGDVLARCGGTFREVVEHEGGGEILYEVCTNCGNTRHMTPTVLRENTVIAPRRIRGEVSRGK